MKHKSIIKCLVLTAGLSITALSIAASDGNLGAESTGETDISLTIPALAQITKLQNITLTPVTITGGVTGATTACIYSNSSGNYQVKVDGSGAGSAFTVTDGTNIVAYTATWDDTPGTTPSPAPLTSGSELTGQAGANTSSTSCGGATNTNASFAIDFAEAALSAAPNGVYTGTATIVITPT